MNSLNLELSSKRMYSKKTAVTQTITTPSANPKLFRKKKIRIKKKKALNKPPQR